MASRVTSADPMATERSPRRSAIFLRTIVAIVLGGWLIWQIGSVGVAGLATRSLDARLLAVTDARAHPAAGALLAEQLLALGQIADAAATARSVVLVDPSNARALRVLGLATDQLGEHGTATAIMRQAEKLGWRDTPTQLWAIRDAALHGDAVTVIQRADALARRNQSGDLTNSVFLAALTEPHLRAALIESLAAQPGWRGAFFADIHQRLPATAADDVELLFREMRVRGVASTPVERLTYMDRLIDLGQVKRAHRLWVQSFGITADQASRTPYDPRFALVASRAVDAPTSRFEWQLNPNLIGAVAFGGDAGGSGLSIPTDIVGGTVIASQVLNLPSGAHVVSAQVSGSGAAAAAGWTISCLPSRQDLPRRVAHGADDELSNVSFDVPSEGCAAQQLSLTSRDRVDAQPVTINEVTVR